MFGSMKTEVAKSYAETKAALAKSGLGMVDVQRLAIDAALVEARSHPPY